MKGTSSIDRTKVHLAGVVRNGALADVVLSAGCPHCRGTILLDADSVSHSLALATAEPESSRTRGARHGVRLFDLMRTDVPCVAHTTRVDAVSRLLANGTHSHVAVMNEQELPVGIVTPEEVFRCLDLKDTARERLTALDLMTRRAICMDADTPAEQAVALLSSREALCIVVVSDTGRLLGLVTAFELIRWLNTRSRSSAG